MQQGQYIADRWMEEILADICERESIALHSFSQNWIYELTRGDKTGRVFGYRFSLNDSVSSQIASDKVATYELLHSANIPAVEHRLVRTKISHPQTWASGLKQIVIKPLDGTSGHNVKLCSNQAEAERYMAQYEGISGWTASPFENIDTERRLIMLDGVVLLQYDKQPVIRDGLAMFNLGLGAQAIPAKEDAAITELAARALKALGLRLAAVDVVTMGGEHKVLEVNDGIMMENYMRQSSENKADAVEVYQAIIREMMR